MDKLDLLVAHNELQTLKARYWRLVDTKDWQGLLDTVFTEDFKGDYRAAGGEAFDSAAGVVAMFEAALGEAVTAHMGGPPEIELINADEANAIWPFNDRLEYPSGILTGAGHYHETYVRTAAGWRMSSARITRQYQRFDATPLDP